MTPEKCERELQDIAKKTPMVRFLLEALDKAGCPVNQDFFEVQYCSQAVLGGFRPDQGVVLCHNNLMSRTDMENMLSHELVHAYDHCRYETNERFVSTKTPSANPSTLRPFDSSTLRPGDPATRRPEDPATRDRTLKA
jgi:hypothetical protein